MSRVWTYILFIFRPGHREIKRSASLLRASTAGGYTLRLTNMFASEKTGGRSRTSTMLHRQARWSSMRSSCQQKDGLEARCQPPFVNRLVCGLVCVRVASEKTGGRRSRTSTLLHRQSRWSSMRSNDPFAQ